MKIIISEDQYYNLSLRRRLGGIINVASDIIDDGDEFYGNLNFCRYYPTFQKYIKNIVGGGYNFKWIIDIVEDRDFDYYLYGHILPGGSVTLMDGRTLSLSEALEDEDLGWELEGEISDVVEDCMNSIILPVTGTEINVPLMKLFGR